MWPAVPAQTGDVNLDLLPDAGVIVIPFASPNSPSIELGQLVLAPALVGGFIVAIAENLAVLGRGGGASPAAAFAVLLVFLAVRPDGIFGTPEGRRV